MLENKISKPPRPESEQGQGLILRVAVFSPLRKCFDYFLENNSEIALQPGMRVRVPFGTKERIGVIVEITTHSNLAIDKLKSVIQVLDEQPLFPESIFNLILWASEYYHHPIGEVFETAIPAYLRKGKVFPISSCSTDVSTEMSLPPLSFTKAVDLNIQLNPEQQEALRTLICALEKAGFQSFLMEGVTGSGKTEVYMGGIQKALEQQKQALVLVPEIGLIPQMFQRLQERFNIEIAVLHSGLTDKTRFLAWNKARTGEASIVLGTRSAVFTPLQKPGLFILDEEHDVSFKQQEGIRYSARDALIMRAHIEQCPVVLGSATPSLESLNNVIKKRYRKIVLPTRINQTTPPSVQILDIRHKKLKEGLSHALIHHMKRHLEAKGQVMLFLNRRGFSPVLMCFECGFIAECKHCDAKLTLHYQKQHLKCHHCEYTTALFSTCPSCGNQPLNPVGFGTERLEAVLKNEFPEYPLLRIDKDTTRKKGVFETYVQAIQSGEAKILLGTQMLAKGHHFPNLTLVAILDIDNALFSLDFRSTERLGQLLTQVAGRAGRATRLGEVFLQTCHPNHPLLQLLLKQGYGAFAEKLLIERHMAKLPPYSHQVLFRAEAKNANTALEFLMKIKNHINRINQLHFEVEKTKTSAALEFLGPIAAPMERKSGKYHAQLLLESENRPSLQKILSLTIRDLETEKTNHKVRWSVDVDPCEMF